MEIPAMFYPAAVALVLTIVGWPLMLYLNSRLKDLTDCINFDASRKLNVLKIDILPKLKQILSEVEGQKLMEAARNRYSAVTVLDQMVKDLKSALCEAEDTLDLLEYHRLKKNAEEACQEDGSAIDSFLSAISVLWFVPKWKLKNRIENMENIISDVHKSAVYISAQNDITNKKTKVGSNAIQKVIGRDQERKSLIQKLYERLPAGDAMSSSNSPCYSVIGIHGIPGSGKTTLAQHVLDCIKEDEKKYKSVDHIQEDEEKDRKFDPVMWVHVSEKFSLNGVYCDMLNKNTVNQDSNILNRQHLQEELKTKLSDKRFLLVLDDLWVKGTNYHELDELFSALNVGMRGSKILVTSQSKDIAGIPGASELVEMSDLERGKYFDLFMHYALDLDIEVSLDDHREYIKIGRKIVAKLHNSPLAAALVARQLRMKKNIHFWSTVAEHDNLNETREYLWWSYQRLDMDIRRCFEFCSIFPEGFKLERDELVRIWVAQGFLCASETEDREAVGNRYIHELLACSFLQLYKKTSTTEYYTMHGLLRDLVEEVGGRDYFRIENDWTRKAPEDVMHLFIETYDGPALAKQIVKLKRLRTLIINRATSETTIEERDFEHMFTSLPKLRVLAIREALQQEDEEARSTLSTFSFPACMKHLKHLRYFVLGLVGVSIILPGTFAQLYHIQTVDFGCRTQMLFSSDEDTTWLSNLQHLILNLWHLISSAARVLVNIAGLALGQIEAFFAVKDDKEYQLVQLKHVNKLQSKLHIHRLESVKSKRVAAEANLAAKVLLKELILSWQYSIDGSRAIEAVVLEALCPPASLETLRIWGYYALEYPTWMLKPYFKHLRTLCLKDCDWNTLPVGMKHLTSLKYLYINNCMNISRLPSMPRSLVHIEIVGCDEDFMESCTKVGDENWNKIRHIPGRIIDPPAGGNISIYPINLPDSFPAPTPVRLKQRYIGKKKGKIARTHDLFFNKHAHDNVSLLAAEGQ